jgi:tetratricopeptide (TPR) repeat protein
MRLVTRLCLFVLGAVLATVYGGCNRPQESVLLVTAGAARGADVSLGGPAGLRNHVAESPAPDSVAAAAAVLTGARPATPSWPGEGDAARVAPAVPRLAEAMKSQGYETRAYIGEGSISTLTGLARGFDSFETPSSPTLAAIAADESGRLRPWRGGFVPASEVASAFLSYLKARPNQNPLFVWIHFGDPVGRFDPAQPKEAYDAAIKDVNEAIGLLRDALDSYGLAGRTTMIVAPLYGMGLGEQGEQRFGLTLSDPVALETVSVVGSGAERFKFPASLAGLHDAILDLLGVDPAKAPRTGPAPAVAVATLPDRLYGWPALRRAAGEPAPPLVSNPGEAPPVDVLARMGEAHLALAADRLPDAVAALREASRLAPRAIAPRALLVQLLPPAERAPLLDELKAIAGISVPRRIDVARTLSGAEDPAGARAILDQLVAGPLTPGERVAVAEQLSTIGATEAAIEQVQLLIDEDKDAPELYEWQGDLFMQTQNAYRARVAYERALESPRQRSAGLVAKLGNALVDLNEKDAALLRFAEATKLDPSYRYPYTRAAELLLAQGKEGEAATALMKSVGATGDPVQDVLNQARALERAGLLSYAATIVDQALAKDPQNLALQLGMARLLGAGGRHDDARSRLQAVLATQPGVAQAWVELARVEAEAGNETAAIAALDKAEAVAGPQITETVRTDKTLLKGGPGSALARRAQAFQGRGQAKAQPPTQRAVGGAPAGTP